MTGRRVSRLPVTYGYDAAGRTTSVVSSAGTTTLAYDFESRVRTIAGPGVSNSFTCNGLDTRVGKVDSSGTATYRRDGADVLAPVLSDGAAVYTPGVSQRRAGATTFDLSDRLGTASRQTNAAKSTTATRTYDAFGMLLASSGTPKGLFGFAGAHGYQEDTDTGLKLLGHRYYDPSTGRFLTRDPVKDGRNWYAYCEGNPTVGVDPDGLWWKMALRIALLVIEAILPPKAGDPGGIIGPPGSSMPPVSGGPPAPEPGPTGPAGGPGPEPLPRPGPDGTVNVPSSSLGGEAGGLRIGGVATTVLVGSVAAGQGIVEVVHHRRRIQDYVNAIDDDDGSADAWEH